MNTFLNRNLTLFLGLIAVLFFSLISESNAQCTNGEMVCGNNCCATFDNGTLTVSGTGTMYEYWASCNDSRKAAECDAYGNPPPWENLYDDIRIVTFTEDSEITNIGAKAFVNAKNLSKIIFPDSLDTIGYKAFKYSSVNSVTVPDTVSSIGTEALTMDSDTLENLKIICKGDIEKCQSAFEIYKITGGTIVDLSDNILSATKEQCTGDKYFWNGTSCSRKEAYCNDNMYYTGIECLMRPTDSKDIVCEHTISGYVKMGDNCVSPKNSYAKQHYTPAEANQWLYDDNNTVILTFKVNR